MAEEIFELSKLASVVRSRQTLESQSLSESEFLALDLIAKQEPLTIGEIQRHIGVVPAQMSRIIRSLESHEDSPLVHCSINPADRRRVDVSLTDAGRQLYNKYREKRLRFTELILGDMSQGDRREFIRLMRMIRENLDERLKSADAQS